MNKLQVGQRVIYDGVETSVTAVWALGRFYKHVFADGRSILCDIDPLIADQRLVTVDRSYELPTFDEVPEEPLDDEDEEDFDDED